MTRPALAVLAILASMVQAASAQEAVVEEIIVTGSYIKGSPLDAPSPVEIIDRAEMEARGSPSVTELVQRLSPVAGAAGRTNPFVSEGYDGTASINMRAWVPNARWCF